MDAFIGQCVLRIKEREARERERKEWLRRLAREVAKAARENWSKDKVH